MEAKYKLSKCQRGVKSSVMTATESKRRLEKSAPELAEACRQAEKLLTTIANQMGNITAGTDCDTLLVRRILEAALAKAGVA